MEKNLHVLLKITHYSQILNGLLNKFYKPKFIIS